MKVLPCVAVWLLVVGAGSALQSLTGRGEWLAASIVVAFVSYGFMWEWLNDEI